METMTDRDTAMVLAALRLYQTHLTTGTPLPDGIADIAGTAPTAESIDDLCERLNAPPPASGAQGPAFPASFT